MSPRHYEIITFFKVVSAIAHADRKIQSKELELLLELKKTFELSEKDNGIIDRIIKRPVKLESIKWKEMTEEAKHFYLAAAWRIAVADGKVRLNESKMLKELIMLIGISSGKFNSMIKKRFDSNLSKVLGI